MVLIVTLWDDNVEVTPLLCKSSHHAALFSRLGHLYLPALPTLKDNVNN